VEIVGVFDALQADFERALRFSFKARFPALSAP
jgi:hypothetical protein